MREEVLEEIIRSGDVERCVTFFTDMPEKERKKLAPLTIRFLRASDSGPFVQCQRVAVLATASLAQLKRFGPEVISSSYDYDIDPEIETLCDRKPEWLWDWCEWLLQRFEWEWKFVRRLVRRGACETPDTDNYVLGMSWGLTGRNTTILDGLRNDPELLPLVWRLFEVEGFTPLVPGSSSAFYDEERSWEFALRELSRNGELDRERLLDASLDALQRDFPKHQAAWYARFHDYMEPTAEERAARMDRYHDLLANPLPPIVTFAVKALRLLHKGGELDTTAFVARTEPALYAGTKSVAGPVLAMLTDIAGENPALGGEAALRATAALEHKASEIQDVALALIESHGDPMDDLLRMAVQDRLPVMTPSTRKHAEAWLGENGVPEALEVSKDLAGMMSRARALPTRLSRRVGVDHALAELEALQGSIPALNNATLSGSVRLVMNRLLTPVHFIRRFLRRTLSPAGLASLPVIFLVLVIAAPFYLFRRAKFRSAIDEVTFEAHGSGRGGISRLLWRMSPRPLYAQTAIDTEERMDRQRPTYEPPLPGYEVALDADTPFHRSGPYMLCMGLSAYDTAEGQLATDLLIRTVEDGRLDGELLGNAMRHLLRGGHIKPNRWVDRLNVAVTESPLHAQVVRTALERSFGGLEAALPRNILLLMELQHNLCVEAEETIADPDCRAFLEGIGGAGKAAKLAKKLLALEVGDPLPHRRAAAVVALRGRLERAERWADRR